MSEQIRIHTAEEEEQNFNQFEEVSDAVQAEIKELFDQYGGDTRFNVVLYRTDPVTGKTKQLARYNEVFPDQHEIGVTHGAGDYVVFINYPDPSTKTGKGLKKRRFSLDDHYNKLREENDAKKLQSFYYANKGMLQNNNSGGNSDLIAMMQMQSQSMQQMFLQMMQMQQAASQNMVQLAGTILPLLVKKDDSMKEYLPLLLESNKQKFEIMKEGFEFGKSINTPEEKGIMDIVETLIENADKLLNPFIPKSMARAQIAANPEIQNIINHEDRFNQVKNELVKKYGAEKTERILNKAGINKPKPSALQSNEKAGQVIEL